MGYSSFSEFRRLLVSKFFSLIVLISLLFSSSFAQSKKYAESSVPNAFYIELLGIGGYFSLNYERMIVDRNPFYIGLRTGYSSYQFKDFNNKFNPDIILPIALNTYYGFRHHVEFGIGPTLSSVVKAHPTKYTSTRDLLINLNLSLGYRYQKPEGGFMFRAGLTPYVQLYRISERQFNNNFNTFRLWGGVSCGYTF